MELFGLIKLTFTDKETLLQTIKQEEWSGTLAFLAMLYGWYVLITAPFFILSKYLAESTIPIKEYIAVMPISYALIFVIWISWLFVWSGIVHIFVTIFKGQGQYKDTFKAIAYGITPLFLIGSAMFYLKLLNPNLYLLIIIVYIYSLYLIIKGVSELHEIGIFKATTAYMIPFLTLLTTLIWFVWKTDLIKLIKTIGL